MRSIFLEARIDLLALFLARSIFLLAFLDFLHLFVNAPFCLLALLFRFALASGRKQLRATEIVQKLGLAQISSGRDLAIFKFNTPSKVDGIFIPPQPLHKTKFTFLAQKFLLPPLNVTGWPSIVAEIELAHGPAQDQALALSTLPMNFSLICRGNRYGFALFHCLPLAAPKPIAVPIATTAAAPLRLFHHCSGLCR